MEKRDIRSLLAKKPTVEQIESITAEVHPPYGQPIQPTQPTQVVESLKPITRISVNALTPLYIKAKTKATLQNKSLMQYIIDLMEKDTAGM